jgi:hypothetical protein
MSGCPAITGSAPTRRNASAPSPAAVLRLGGRHKLIHQARDGKLAEAREHRKQVRQALRESPKTAPKAPARPAIDFAAVRAAFTLAAVLNLLVEDVAIDQEEDAFLGLRFPQAPDDLKSRVGFAGSGGHYQKDPILAPRDGFDGAIDGDELVITRGLLRSVVKVVLGGDRFLFGRGTLGRPVPCPEFVGGRELIDRNFAGNGCGSRRAVVFEEGVPPLELKAKGTSSISANSMATPEISIRCKRRGFRS